MKLSIIIVNYNVKFFLAQCLNSVKLSIESLGQETEVFVVDNHSVDGSVQLIKEQYSWVKLIENKENVGFSKANNQAIKIARGEYILLLNPDTVLEQDTLKKTISYMDSNRQVGGLGVRMIDGKGNFLPESKRGLPTPKVAFFKISGLSKIFYRSKIFNRYHLGYLNEFEIHEVDVLSGAFMLLRKSVLDKIGLLDETFFMYGEDVDLSYRIIQAGYKNIYFPETTIIHYKGESTKKGSINYVRLFYSAMAIFAEKHFKNNQAKFFTWLINLAIWLRALVSIVKRIVLAVMVPIIDLLIIFLVFYSVTQFWQYVKFHGQSTYPNEFIYYVLPVYSLLMLFGLFYAGLYSKKPLWIDLFKGIGLGSLLILSLYALLSEDLRYSRAVVLLGILFVATILPLFRYILSSIDIFKIGKPKKKRAIVIASQDEYDRITMLLSKTSDYVHLIRVTPTNNEDNAIGNLYDLEEIINVHKIHEIIFSSKDLSSKTIIELMTKMSELQLDFKIVGDAIIGSKTVYTNEPTFEIYLNSVSKPINKRNKRMFDIFSSLILLMLSPLMLVLVKNKKQFIINLFQVLIGIKTWIGYAKPAKAELPRMKSCIIPITFSENEFHINEINLLYAKDYKIMFDILYLWKNLKNIDLKSRN